MKRFLLYLITFVVCFNAKSQVTDYQNWMAGLDDNAFICQLSIPGAHNACTSSFSGTSSLAALVAGKVQTKSVQDMLPLGVRAFDLRPAVKDGTLTNCHGILVTSFSFNTIMQQLCNYLDAHPSEFCVIVSRHEIEADDGDSSFGSKLQASLASFKDHLVDFRPNLTVGEARGKILFISRDAYDEPMYGGRTVDLRDNRSDISEMLGGHCYGPGSYKCSWWSQGYYSYSDVNLKKKAILDMLEMSYKLAGTYTYIWVNNGLAGYNGEGTNSACQANAKTCNPYLQSLLASGNYNGPVGLVFMDYICDGDNSGYYGLSLTKELVNHNFRYTMSKQGDLIYDDKGRLFLAPKGQEMMWEGKLLRKESNTESGPSGWTKTDFNDSEWETVNFPVASSGANAPYYSLWDGTNNTVFIRREFYVDNDASIDTFTFYVRHDDDYTVYLNGTQLDSQTGSIEEYRTVSIPSSNLHVGRNVLAIQVKQYTGITYFDCGVLFAEGTHVPLWLPDDTWQTTIVSGRNLDFTDTNVEAYKITGVMGETIVALAKEESMDIPIVEEWASPDVAYIIKEKADIVPVGEVILVRSDSGKGTYNIPITKSSAIFTDNLLKVVTANRLKVPQANTIYCLEEQNSLQGFYPKGAGKYLTRGKVYLDLSESSIRPNIILFSPDDATGINGVEPSISKQGPTIFNLAGQRLNKPQRGLNIINGRKILY